MPTDSEKPNTIPSVDALESSPSPEVPTAQSRVNSDSKRAKTVTQSLKEESLQLENEARRQQLDQLANDHRQILKLRWILGISGLLIVVFWQFCILGLVYLLGVGQITIPQPVMLTLISTTTINVFGLLIIVLQFVFPRRPTSSKKPKLRT